MGPNIEYSLIHAQNFIRATRDTGYRSTASAIAELIDNALQANAKQVRVQVDQNGIGMERELRVAVIDDGTGMDARTLRTSLRFGGTSRFDDRTGLGRFGMGLPNSSVSQARRLDVFTWRHSSRMLHSYLDVDEIAEGTMREVPSPRPAKLPSWISGEVAPSGTAIVWTKCDRLDHRKATTVVRHLSPVLGQWFRYALWKKVKIIINGERLQPVDPLFVQGVNGHGKASLFAESIEYEVRVPTDPARTSMVRVTFSELPVREWHGLTVDQKRDLGITKHAGVSVVCAGREIDYGWHFMGAKRRENYDDWWRCEVQFDPLLDECFGVTHSKQGVKPSEFIEAILAPNLEAIAHTLNSRVRAAFASVKMSGAPASLSHVATKDKFLPVLAAATSRKGVQARNSGVESDDRKYEMRVESLSRPEFHIHEIKENGVIRVIINRNHPFYEQMYAPLDDPRRQKELAMLQSLILASVRADLAIEAEEIANSRRVLWSHALSAFLGD